MSVKGEKYSSMPAKKKHEMKESPAMRLKEYGMKKSSTKRMGKKK